MPRTPSSPADRPKWLRFEAGDEESHELFAPGANWRKQDQYPVLKPLDSYTRDDYLRLAWELLRRMPRYRRQHRKLDQLGIKSPSFFKSSPKHFYTSDSPPAFPGWATCPLRGHQCEPPIAGQDETFGSYIAAQEKAGQPWFVMNRYRWVMDLWGITYVPNPATHFDQLRKSGLFGAPAAAVSVISNEAPADRPQNISTYLRANEVLVRLRLDASFDQQVESIRHEFERAQAIARKRPQRALDPLPAPGRRLMGKAVLRDEDFSGDFSPRAAAKVGRVLLKHVELHPFWLRTWDALAEARLAQGTLNPRLDRDLIVRQFHADYGHLDHPRGGVAGKATHRRRKNTVLVDLIGAAIGSSAMVPNWRARSEKYIEESDDAFRQIVATAFAMRTD